MTWFLALTVQRPDPHDLGEYPLFLGVNVLLVAVSGTLALVHQCRQLLAEHAIPMARGVLLVGTWLAASLFVGAQASWYLRRRHRPSPVSSTPWRSRGECAGGASTRRHWRPPAAARR